MRSTETFSPLCEWVQNQHAGAVEFAGDFVPLVSTDNKPVNILIVECEARFEERAYHIANDRILEESGAWLHGIWIQYHQDFFAKYSTDRPFNIIVIAVATAIEKHKAGMLAAFGVFVELFLSLVCEFAKVVSVPE